MFSLEWFEISTCSSIVVERIILIVSLKISVLIIFNVATIAYNSSPKYFFLFLQNVMNTVLNVVLQRNLVGYDEGQPRMLEKAVVLEDLLSDLPPVSIHDLNLMYLYAGNIGREHRIT